MMCLICFEDPCTKCPRKATRAKPTSNPRSAPKATTEQPPTPQESSEENTLGRALTLLISRGLMSLSSFDEHRVLMPMPRDRAKFLLDLAVESTFEVECDEYR